MRFKNYIIYLSCLFILLGCKENQQKITADGSEIDIEKNSGARDIIKKVVAKKGTIDDLKELKDVEYTYVLNAVGRNIKNVSTERYIFDGELSWAQYLPDLQFPKRKYTTTEGYNGTTTWVRIDKNLSDEPKKIQFASFVRQTNFYWFAMMQKLLDPGVNHKILDSRIVGSIEYQIIEMTFNQNIGKVQDKYILYINPETNLVDQFLFTVKELDYAPTDPLLMRVQYTSVDGIRLMGRRVVRKSDWKGKDNGEIVYEQHYENIKFNNGFSNDMFDSPIIQN